VGRHGETAFFCCYDYFLLEINQIPAFFRCGQAEMHMPHTWSLFDILSFSKYLSHLFTSSLCSRDSSSENNLPRMAFAGQELVHWVHEPQRLSMMVLFSLKGASVSTVVHRTAGP